MNKITVFSPKGAAVVAAVSLTSWLGGSIFERIRSKSQQGPVVTVRQPPVSSSSPLDVVLVDGFVPSGRKDLPVKSTSDALSLQDVRFFSDYVVSYDRRTKVANWVVEHLTQDKLNYKSNVDRAKCEFKPDPTIHPYFRSTNEDYFKSGFDRGHLAAAGNHKLEQAHCDQTFYLSNIAPQVGAGFNRHRWNHLEKYVRGLVKHHRNVYVCTGPLFLPYQDVDGKKYVKYQVIGMNNVAVPTHFFKIVVAETNNSTFKLEVFVMPNAPIDNSVPLSSFQVSPDVVEKYSGLLFYDKIPKNKLESVNGKTPKKQLAWT